MVRKAISGTQLNSWDEVDDSLRQIAELDRDMALHESAANEKIDQVKAGLKGLVQPMLDRKAGLELAIKDYCDANRVEFAKIKTKEMPFGSVGYRLTTKIMIKRVAETLQSLKDLALTGCIRIKEEPDKEAMKNLTDAQLAEVGAARKTENVFGYTINTERIKEAA